MWFHTLSCQCVLGVSYLAFAPYGMHCSSVFGRNTHIFPQPLLTTLVTFLLISLHVPKPGITMELLETRGDVHFFTFEHSKSYQAIQFQFLDAVETFNPDNIVVSCFILCVLCAWVLSLNNVQSFRFLVLYSLSLLF